MAMVITADAARQQIWDNHISEINQKIIGNINAGLYMVTINTSEISSLILNDFVTYLQTNGYNTTIETSNVGNLIRIDWSTPVVPPVV